MKKFYLALALSLLTALTPASASAHGWDEEFRPIDCEFYDGCGEPVDECWFDSCDRPVEECWEEEYCVDPIEECNFEFSFRRCDFDDTTDW